jgi:hypothetical protein
MRSHLKLLNGNFVGMVDRDQFLARLVADARAADDAYLAEELTGDWRSRLTAAWLIGVDRRAGFRAELARLLLASELTYAGQGYAFALARLDSSADLASYLDRYLVVEPRVEYDQRWVFAALSHVDPARASRYLGLFERWSLGHRDATVEKLVFADVYALVPG